jgi:ubiquinone biosynthesis protein UbiJ
MAKQEQLYLESIDNPPLTDSEKKKAFRMALKKKEIDDITMLTCDVCGSRANVITDWEGDTLCEVHRMEKELDSVVQAHKKHKEWIENVHHSKLKKMEDEIKELKKQLDQLEHKAKWT